MLTGTNWSTGKPVWGVVASPQTSSNETEQERMWRSMGVFPQSKADPSSLASMLSGAGAPVVPLNLSSTPNPELTSWASSQAPRQELQGYTGPTSVQMSPETQASLAQILALMSSPGFQSLLSGQTNQGLFQSGVVNPMQREFQNTILPGIMDQYTGGPYGAGYWGGTRQKAGQEAQNKLQEQIAGLRYQDYNNAQNRSLQAAGLLPQFSQALSLKEQLAGQNLQRGIDVHYQNQGLKAKQFEEDMNFVNSLLGAQNNLNQQLLAQRGQDIGQASDIRGNQLSLSQMALNRELGVMGNETSRSNALLAANTAASQAAAQNQLAQQRMAMEAAQNAQNRQDTLDLIKMYYNKQRSSTGQTGISSNYPSGMGVILNSTQPGTPWRVDPTQQYPSLRQIFDSSKYYDNNNSTSSRTV